MNRSKNEMVDENLWESRLKKDLGLECKTFSVLFQTSVGSLPILPSLPFGYCAFPSLIIGKAFFK